MCGISGIISKQSIRINKEIVGINNTIKHRGPDDEGYLLINSNTSIPLAGNDTPQEVLQSNISYCPNKHIKDVDINCNIAMGHRRLSIIDISSSGHQPMSYNNGRYWVVFNGEIYNYLELKAEITQLGGKFSSNSDTEVVLAAYKTWGEQCVDHFDGMWAFVIYDQEKNILFGSRDRLGVKPLYYYHNSNYFLFASEQKALVKSELCETEINDQAVFDYLVLSHSETEMEGFFKNILTLKPGNNFIFNLEHFSYKESSYYDTHNITEAVGLKGNMSDKLLHILKNAIKLRTRSDVEIGSCLSGGIDSSFIVMLLNESLSYDNTLKVFTAIYDNSEFDERDWAKKVVINTGAEWHKTAPSNSELIESLKDIIYHADTPILTTSTYAQYKVMQLASNNGIKVLLDGQGADELFAGYDVFYYTYFNELMKRFKLYTLIKELKANNQFYLNMKNWLLSDITILTKRLPSRLSRFFYERSVYELKYINKDLKEAYLNRFGKVYFPFGSNLNNTLKSYAGGEKLQVLLRLEDRMSMRFSIESRTPFADDYNLINFALSLPSKYKIKNGVRKHILRDAGKGILPDEIRNRKDKIGFQTPEIEWLRKIRHEIPELLTNNLREYVNVDLVTKELDMLINNPTSKSSSRLLRFLLFAQWREIFKI